MKIKLLNISYFNRKQKFTHQQFMLKKLIQQTERKLHEHINITKMKTALQTYNQFC